MTHLTNVRYGYFDALRGFAILLVVFSHIMCGSFGIKDGIQLFFCSFHMPLFFFVSGFFAFKDIGIWNKDNIKDNIKRKIKVQIFGASIFLTLFLLFMRNRLPDVQDFISPGRYWFTFVLFKIFITYMAIVLICRNTCHRKRNFWRVIIFIAVLSICIHFSFPLLKIIMPSILYKAIDYLVSPLYFYYLPYFTLGLIARAHMGRFELIISHDGVKAGTLTAIVAIWGMINLGYIQPISIDIVHGVSAMSYPLGILTLILAVQFFYSIRIDLECNTVFCKAIKFIGRRTLDIYFIHYFFEPHLEFLKPFLISANPIIIQLILGFIVVLIIVSLSLLVGQIIRMSPTLGEWLLGVKKAFS